MHTPLPAFLPVTPRHTSALGVAAAPPQVKVLMPIRSPLRLQKQALAIEVQAGRALTLRVQRAGTLRISGARVWLTSTLASVGAGGPACGDVFLLSGQALNVTPGQSWVVESFPDVAAGDSGSANTASCLDWLPAPSVAMRWSLAFRRWWAASDAAQGSRASSRASPA